MRRRLLIMAILILAGCEAATVDHGAATPTLAAPIVEITPEPTDLPAGTPTPITFKDITLKGKGKRVAKFTIPEDAVAIAQATYGGSSNFALTSIAADGSHNALLVNTIGKYKGTVLFDVGEGEHSVAFDIEAAGSWTIVIQPVTSARLWNGTTPLQGTGDDVVKVAPPSSGLVTLDLIYKGSSNFAVKAYSPDGTDLLANEISNFSGQVLVPDGTFLLEISADGGTWSAKPG
jgi:hypothetical protein